MMELTMDANDRKAVLFHVTAIIDGIMNDNIDQESIDVHNEALEIIKQRNNRLEVDHMILGIVANRLGRYKHELMRRRENQS